MVCAYCGNNISEGSGFCLHCGKPVPKNFHDGNIIVKTSGLAIASLVCSIVGLFMCLFIGQIAGLILGYQAKKEIRQSGGRIEGENLATAGIIVGWIGIAMDILIVLFLGLFIFLGV